MTSDDKVTQVLINTSLYILIYVCLAELSEINDLLRVMQKPARKKNIYISRQLYTSGVDS